MPLNDNLLQNLMELSPEISDYVTGQRSIMSAITPGEITMNTIVNGCFEILINLLKREGILFAVETNELLEDYFNASYLITLYNIFAPANLYNVLKDDPGLFKAIQSELEDVSDNEKLTHMLQVLQKKHPTDINRGMMAFLHDKATSSWHYSAALDTIFERVTAILEDDRSVDNSMPFIANLISERNHFMRIIESMVRDDFEKLSTAYPNGFSQLVSDLTQYYPNFRNEFVQTSNMYGLISSINDTANLEVRDSILNKIRRSSRWYLEYYDNLSITPSIMEVIMMIVAAFSDQRLFGITPDFSKLYEISPDVDTLIRHITYVPYTNEGNQQ